MLCEQTLDKCVSETADVLPKGTLFRYRFSCDQKPDVFERISLMLIRLQFDVIEGEVKVDGDYGSGLFIMEHPLQYETDDDLNRFKVASLTCLSKCFDDISKWEAKSATRPAVDPDLISVLQLQEMEGPKDTSIGEKVYNLDVFAINQAGLLGYLCSLISQSGFDITYSKFNCVTGTQPATGTFIRRRDSTITDILPNFPSLKSAPAITDKGMPLSSSKCSLETQSTQTPPATLSDTPPITMNSSLWSLPLIMHTDKSQATEQPAQKEIKQEARYGGSARLIFHIRPKKYYQGVINPICTLRQVLEFPEPEKKRKKCFLLNRAVHRKPLLAGGIQTEKWWIAKGKVRETTFSNGDIYIGELVNNTRHGFGVYKYNGTSDARKKYEGQWINNAKHGYGIVYWANGDAYAGEWQHNKRHGFGVMMRSTRETCASSRFEGEWRNDMPDGLGVEEKSDSCYFGSYIKGHRHGKGLEVKLLEHKYEVVVRESASGEDARSTSRAHLFETLRHSRPAEATGSTDLGSGSSASTRRQGIAASVQNDGIKNELQSPAPETLKGCKLGQLLEILGISEISQNLVSNDGINGEDLLNATNEACGRRFCMYPVEILVVKKCLRLLSTNHRVEWSLFALNTHARVNLSEVGINSVLNRYVIDEDEIEKTRRISAGGFGTVYEGHWKKHGMVALKEMRGDSTRNLAELLKEATVSAAMDHKNICKFLGVSQSLPTKRFIVYEYLPWSLFDMIHTPRVLFDERPQMNTMTRLRIAEHISRGVSYMHSIGVIHADLKSPNVLVSCDQDGMRSVTAKLCDFGHAAVRPLPRPHTRLGTPHWAAPEALRGEAISYPCDVWAFGVICWEMLTSKVPFAGLSSSSVIAAVGWGGKNPAEAEKCYCELGLLSSECTQTSIADRPQITSCTTRVRKMRAQNAATSVCCNVFRWFQS